MKFKTGNSLRNEVYNLSWSRGRNLREKKTYSGLFKIWYFLGNPCLFCLHQWSLQRLRYFDTASLLPPQNFLAQDWQLSLKSQRDIFAESPNQTYKSSRAQCYACMLTWTGLQSKTSPVYSLSVDLETIYKGEIKKCLAQWWHSEKEEYCLLCRLGWPRTQRDLLTPASWVLGLKAWLLHLAEYIFKAIKDTEKKLWLNYFLWNFICLHIKYHWLLLLLAPNCGEC